MRNAELGIGNWELGIGNWELGIGNWEIRENLRRLIAWEGHIELTEVFDERMTGYDLSRSLDK